MFSLKDKKEFIDGWVKSKKKITKPNRDKVAAYVMDLTLWDDVMETYANEKSLTNVTGIQLWSIMSKDKNTIRYPGISGNKSVRLLVNTVLSDYLKKQPAKMKLGDFLREVVDNKDPLKETTIEKLSETTLEKFKKDVGPVDKQTEDEMKFISKKASKKFIDEQKLEDVFEEVKIESEIDKVILDEETKALTDKQVDEEVDRLLGREVHLQTPSRSYNFVGAGTNLRERMSGKPPSKTVFGKGTPPYGVPVDELDWEALKHDMFYISDSPLVRRYADSEFTEELSRMKGVTPAISKQLINLKVLTESKLPKSRNELQGMMNKKERAHLKMTEDMFKSYTNLLVARGYKLDPETRDTIKVEPLQNIDDYEKSFKEFEREIYKLKEATDENEIKEIIQDEADLPQMQLLDPLEEVKEEVKTEVKEEVKTEVKEEVKDEKKILAVQPELITPTSPTNVEQELLSQLTQAGSTDLKQTPEEDKTNDEVIMKEFVLKEPEFVDRNNKLKIEEQRNKSIQYLGPMFNQELATDIIHTKKIALQKEPVPPIPELKRQFRYEPLPQTISMKSNYKTTPFKPAHAASNFYSQMIFHARGLIPDEPDNFILF